METFIAISVFISVTALVWALLSRPRNPVQRRLQSFREMAVVDESIEREPSLGERVIRPVAFAVWRSLQSILPSSLFTRLRWRLTLAGDPVGLTGLLIVWAVCAVGLPLLLFIMLSTGGGIGSTHLLLLLAGGFIGAYLPQMWLNMRMRERQTKILKTLPDAIDLLVTSVEAGLGIDAALSQVAEKVKGPLVVELRKVMRDMAMGSARRDALHAFAERTGIADVQQFVNAIIQAEQMGVSLAQVIRVQADQMRLKRRQRAEEKAHKAPVKMTIPLVIFIFPVIFIVIIGPACIQIKESLLK